MLNIYDAFLRCYFETKSSINTLISETENMLCTTIIARETEVISSL